MVKDRKTLIGIIVTLLIVSIVFGLYWTTRRPAVGPETGYMPTVVFDSREKYYPVAFDFDGDMNPTNNAANYVAGIGDMTPVVYYRIIDRDQYQIYQYWLYYAKDGGIWPTGSTAHEHDLETFSVFVKNKQSVILACSPHGGMFGWNLYQIKDSVKQLVNLQELWKHGSGSYGKEFTMVGADRLISEPYKVMSDGSGHVIKPVEFVFRPVEDWLRAENVFFDWWPDNRPKSSYATGTTGQYNLGDMITSTGNGAGVVAPWAYYPELGATCRQEWANPEFILTNEFRRLLE